MPRTGLAVVQKEVPSHPRQVARMFASNDTAYIDKSPKSTYFSSVAYAQL